MPDQIDMLLNEAMLYLNGVEVKGEMNMNNQLLAIIKIREARKLHKEGQNEKRNDA